MKLDLSTHTGLERQRQWFDFKAWSESDAGFDLWPVSESDAFYLISMVVWRCVCGSSANTVTHGRIGILSSGLDGVGYLVCVLCKRNKRRWDGDLDLLLKVDGC